MPPFFVTLQSSASPPIEARREGHPAAVSNDDSERECRYGWPAPPPHFDYFPLEMSESRPEGPSLEDEPNRLFSGRLSLRFRSLPLPPRLDNNIISKRQCQHEPIRAPSDADAKTNAFSTHAHFQDLQASRRRLFVGTRRLPHRKKIPPTARIPQPIIFTAPPPDPAKVVSFGIVFFVVSVCPFSPHRRP
ncbi:hypothetical protein niasHT_002788 [Heterodera trifolii]|uniref:Uncharacterized protein n=1 Tax=Heterodera trifolii TaxID=157864 RepID=A0ABD2M870_9BILA